MRQILLADDVGINRLVLKDFLNEMDNLIIHEACDGFEVMEILKKNDIDLVLLDLIMPNKDGFEVLSEMKQHEVYKHIPVIIQSSLEKTEYVTRALQLGAYDYFIKALGDSLMKNTLVLKVKNAIRSYELHRQIQGELTAKQMIQEQMRRELALASLVQQGFLPKNNEGECFFIRTLYRPLHVVSGDLYDYTWDEEQQILAGYVLDVSGHGVATALITSALQSLIRQAFEKCTSPLGKIQWLNRAIMPYCYEEFYAAIICFEIDFNKKNISYVSGGIHHFLHIENGECKIVSIPGSPIGLFEDAEFQQHTCSFINGDSIIFFTDGIADLLAKPFEARKAGFTDMMGLLHDVVEYREVRDDVTVLGIHMKKI